MVVKLIAAGILAAVFLINNGSATKYPIDPSEYPNPARDETQHGTYPDDTPVIDPYIALEKPNTPETKTFVNEEMQLTEKYLQNGPPGVRGKIEARYQQLWNIENYEGPFQKGEKYFSYRNTGSQKQDVLYVQTSPVDQGNVFLNPNQLEDGATLDKAGSAFSDDGSIFAYLTSKTNSVGKTLQFKSVTGNRLCNEKLTDVSSITWTKDNLAIFYWYVKSGASSTTGTKNYGLRYHVLGTNQDADIDVADFPEKADSVSSKISNDSKYLVVNASVGINKNLVYIADITDVKTVKSKFESLLNEADTSYEFITNKGTKYIFLTNEDAENYKLAVIDIESHKWDDFVSEEAKKVLDWVALAKDKLVLGYIENNRSVLQLHDAESGTQLNTFELELGSVQADAFYSDEKYPDVYFKFVSFLIPGIIYRCDVSKSVIELKKIKEISVPNFKSEDYVVETAVFESEDDTDILMHIVHKKELPKNGKNFAFLTTRGVLGVKKLPYFSVNRVAVVDNMDGVHAVVYVRGEGSEEQYYASNERYKPKSVADFVAAAEYLIQQKYTNSELLAVDGSGSGASGPLMGALLNQRSDLFGALIAEAGLMDLLRYDESPIGQKWISEYGSPKELDSFNFLKKFSPLQNVHVKDQDYPATMILTSENDDRVPALHSLKFAATLQYQAKQQPSQKNPLILDVSKSDEITVKEAVDITQFIVMNTGAEFRA